MRMGGTQRLRPAVDRVADPVPRRAVQPLERRPMPPLVDLLPEPGPAEGAVVGYRVRDSLEHGTCGPGVTAPQPVDLGLALPDGAPGRTQRDRPVVVGHCPGLLSEPGVADPQVEGQTGRPGVELQCALVVPDRCLPPTLAPQHRRLALHELGAALDHVAGRVDPGERCLVVLVDVHRVSGGRREGADGGRSELHRPIERAARLGAPRIGGIEAVSIHECIPNDQGYPGLGEIGIELDGSLEVRDALQLPLAIEVRTCPASQVRLPCLEVLGRSRLDDLDLRPQECDSELANDLARDFGLHGEYVVIGTVEGHRPQVGVVRNADQPGSDSQPCCAGGRLGPAYGAAEQVLDPELIADLPRGLVGLRVLVRAVARDHPQTAHRCEPAGDLFGHAGGEVLVLWRAQVVERQDGNHRADLGLGGRCARGLLLPTADRRQGQGSDHSQHSDGRGERDPRRCAGPPSLSVWSSRQLLQRVAELPCRLEAQGRVLLEAAVDDRLQALWQVAPEAGDRRRLVAEDGRHDVGGALTGERPPAGGHLVQDRAE